MGMLADGEMMLVSNSEGEESEAREGVVRTV